MVKANQKQKDRLQEALDIISEIIGEEEEKLSNMEANFSETEKYQQMEEQKDTLQEVADSLEDCMM